MTAQSRLSTVLILSLALLVPAVASAEPADTFVGDQQQELMTLLRQPKKNDASVTRVLDRVLDYDALARSSLGPLWEERTPAEREEFQKLLTGLVRKSYKKSISDILGYDVTIAGRKDIDEKVLVETVAKSRTNAREEPVQIDYLLHQVDGHWKVADVVTEGSSMVGNYRSQFVKIVKKSGWDALLGKMRKKLG